MDSPNGSHRTEMSTQFKVIDEKMPRSEIVYFALLVLALIISCVFMLALHDPNRENWIVCLTSLVGYILPSPHLPKNITSVTCSLMTSDSSSLHAVNSL